MAATSPLTIEMERALLGCTTHPSGVLVTWSRCRSQCSDDELREIGRQLLERSIARRTADSAQGVECLMSRTRQRCDLIEPFIHVLFGMDQ